MLVVNIDKLCIQIHDGNLESCALQKNKRQKPLPQRSVPVCVCVCTSLTTRNIKALLPLPCLQILLMTENEKSHEEKKSKCNTSAIPELGEAEGLKKKQNRRTKKYILYFILFNQPSLEVAHECVCVCARRVCACSPPALNSQ